MTNYQGTAQKPSQYLSIHIIHAETHAHIHTNKRKHTSTHIHNTPRGGTHYSTRTCPTKRNRHTTCHLPGIPQILQTLNPTHTRTLAYMYVAYTRTLIIAHNTNMQHASTHIMHTDTLPLQVDKHAYVHIHPCTMPYVFRSRIVAHEPSPRPLCFPLSHISTNFSLNTGPNSCRGYKLTLYFAVYDT